MLENFLGLGLLIRVLELGLVDGGKQGMDLVCREHACSYDVPYMSFDYLNYMSTEILLLAGFPTSVKLSL
jgi:hypothetical protein